jgi:hypothetical protein
MYVFVLAPFAATHPHSPSTRTISAAYAALCGVETRRARCVDEADLCQSKGIQGYP